MIWAILGPWMFAYCSRAPILGFVSVDEGLAGCFGYT